MAATWAIGACAAIALAAWWYRRRVYRRPAPDDLERRRRRHIYAIGKLGDGEITDVDGNTILYTYQVAGVSYEASQEVGTLEARLPPNRMSAIGPASIRFDPRNPANSIVICEEWSGLHD